MLVNVCISPVVFPTVRSLLSANNQYLCTIQDNRTPYISCMSIAREALGVGVACVTMVTGGGELNVIDIYHCKQPHQQNKLVMQL